MNLLTMTFLLISQVIDLNPQQQLHSNEDMLWLAMTVYHEARGEPHTGQLAVASTVLNRVESGAWADSIEGVVRQRKQFSGVPSGNIYLLAFNAGRMEPAAWKAASDVSVKAVAGRWYYSRVYPWDHYYAPLVRIEKGLTAMPWWAKKMKRQAIGEHIFCTNRQILYKQAMQGE